MSEHVANLLSHPEIQQSPFVDQLPNPSPIRLLFLAVLLQASFRSQTNHVGLGIAAQDEMSQVIAVFLDELKIFVEHRSAFWTRALSFWEDEDGMIRLDSWILDPPLLGDSD